ncbi:MAG TPA: energy transducer TonB [Acidobacteriota bacterium]
MPIDRRIRLINPKRRKARAPRRGAAGGAAAIDPWWLSYHSPEFETNRKRLQISLLLALLFNAILFVIRLPESPLRISNAGAGASSMLKIQQIKLAPPPPPKPTTTPQAVSKARRIPIPDPTPDEPEIYVVPEPQALPSALTGPTNAVAFGLPDGPPGGGSTGSGFGGPGVYQIGADVSQPVLIKKIDPHYPPQAKANRIQAIVILEAVVQANGRVGDIRVVRTGGGYGFDEEAIAALKQWEFRPAVHQGRPVPVYMTLTVEFTLY